MKKFLPLILLLIFVKGISQNFPGQKDFQWPDNFINYPLVPDSLVKEQAVILKEQIFFTNNFIKKRIAIKIQTEEGVKKFSTVELPENFDITNYPNVNKQGRFKNRKDPFIQEYRIDFFGARVIRGKRIIDLEAINSHKKVYWIRRDGERIYDNISLLQIEGLEVGDILEYTYKAFVNWDETITSVFPSGSLYKMDYYLSASSFVPAALSKIKVIHNYGINEGAIKTTTANSSGGVITTKVIHLENLKSVNYPLNSRPGANLPYVSINYGKFYMTRTSGNSNSAIKSYYYFDPSTWIVNIDTTEKNSFYDKYNANIRKYISNFPDSPLDTFKIDFVSRLVDSLNSLKFISSEDIHYSGNSQYSMSSSELLNKGKLTEEFIGKNYGDLIEAKGVFYYQGIVMDKRLAEVTINQRSLSYLEKDIYVLPVKKSFKYVYPRDKGVKYFLDELPFYLEGISCVLIPRNISVKDDKISVSNILLTRTPKSLFNENVRTESVRCIISTDSMKMNLSFKESVSGQFSTLLRHYYAGECIDSTVSSLYFKKFTDKPLGIPAKITKSSASKTYPFKHSYISSSTIRLQSKNQLDLKEWFSFVFTKEQFREKPNHDFYMDFQFTDTYNYLFEFDKPVEVINADDFTKKLSNECFEITSNLVKQEGNKYLLSVIVKVKQDVIPEKDAMKIMDFVSVLDNLNDLKLNYKIL